MLHQWYEEGLIDSEFSTRSSEDLERMMYTDESGVWFDGFYMLNTRKQLAENENFRLVGINTPVRAEGEVAHLRQSNNYVRGYETAITSACKNPKAAIQYLNYGYTYEGSLPFTFGIEGVHWNWGENGLPQFTDEILHNPQGMTISNVSYALKCHFASRYCYPDAIGHPGTASNQEALRIRTMWAGDTNEQNFLQMPPITLTTEEASERADLMIVINTYAKEMMFKFITGAASLDDFGSYLETVKSYGMDRALEITQTAVNRFYGK